MTFPLHYHFMSVPAFMLYQTRLHSLILGNAHLSVSLVPDLAQKQLIPYKSLYIHWKLYLFLKESLKHDPNPVSGGIFKSASSAKANNLILLTVIP